jgi:hypothetical protein
MVREGPAQRLPEDYDADNARGGVLRRHRQRLVFIGGLIGAVLIMYRPITRVVCGHRHA